MSPRFDAELAVVPPYRLDLTVEALRRLAANVVDHAGPYGYRRLFDDAAGRHAVTVVQIAPDRLRARIEGPDGSARVPDLERMLGTRARLDGWPEVARPYPWLADLAQTFRGLAPPRYPTVWEACAHAIVFQQISIQAAGAIMRRLVEVASEPVAYDGELLYAFPSPRAVLALTTDAMRAAGLSGQKIAHLRSAAETFTAGLSRALLESLPSDLAAQRLQEIRGIGPWSAAIVLLRGLGRIEVFPLRDSGVARALGALSGERSLDVALLLERLGSVRGMLYYHLLLGSRRERGEAWGYSLPDA